MTRASDAAIYGTRVKDNSNLFAWETMCTYAQALLLAFAFSHTHASALFFKGACCVLAVFAFEVSLKLQMFGPVLHVGGLSLFQFVELVKLAAPISAFFCGCA